MTEPKPSLRPTNPATLVVAGLIAAAVAWLLVSTWYNRVPSLQWIPAVTLGALALFEVVVANNTRARIARKPGRLPIQPLLVTRWVVLAKASSLAGAIFGGFMGGMVVALVLKGDNGHARADLPPAIAGFVAALALIAAALWLEHACRIPDQPEDKDEDGAGNGRSGGGNGRMTYARVPVGAQREREEDLH